jgi:hypothetical protein
MSLWQSTMIAIARRRLVTRIMQGNPFARSLAYRFVGGDSVSSAVRRADELKGRGILASLNYLGEYVESPTFVEENVSQISDAVRSAEFCFDVRQRQKVGQCALFDLFFCFRPSFPSAIKKGEVLLCKTLLNIMYIVRWLRGLRTRRPG